VGQPGRANNARLLPKSLGAITMSPDLPQEAREFVVTLTTLDPPPDSVWVIGSRANCRATETSDTDLLVFGSQALIDALRESVPAPERIDCLVVYDGDNDQDPWKTKSGSITKLK